MKNFIYKHQKSLSLIFLVAASILLIFYKYSDIPKGLAHDENELARAAFSLENKPYTPFTPIADGHGTPYFYVLLASFKLFGVNQFALRLPSRISGILCIVLFYLIAKIVLKSVPKPQKISIPLLAWILSLQLLANHWYLHFVRISLETPFLLLLELLSVYFLVLFLEGKRKPLIIMLSGIFAGIAFNSYQPGRFFFLLPLFALCIKKTGWKIVAAYLLTFCIAVFPMVAYLAQHPANDIRINQQLFLKNSQLDWQTKATFFGQNITSTAFMFFTKGDINGQHNYSGKPALNPVISLIALVGLVTAVKNRKFFYNIIFLAYFAIAIAPTILTYPWENPNMLRTFTALPAVVYFIGIAFVEISRRLSSRLKNAALISILFILLLFGSSAYELRTYFKYQPLVFKQAFDLKDFLPTIRKNTLENN